MFFPVKIAFPIAFICVFILVLILLSTMYAQPLPNNAERARWATSLLLVNVCFFAVTVIRDLFKLFAEDVYYSIYRVTQIAETVLNIGQSVLIITTSVFFIMWFRRAYNNLYIAGARFLPYKEGWAAGGWFVPIVHWFYPYRIMNAIWQETPAVVRKVGERYQPEDSSLVGGWWTCWIIGNVVASIENQVILRGAAGLDSPFVLVLSLVSSCGMFFAAILAVRIVKRVAEMEADLQIRYTDWLAYQTQMHARQYSQQQAFAPQQPTVTQNGSGINQNFPPQQ
jgi:hypothetical protein